MITIRSYREFFEFWVAYYNGELIQKHEVRGGDVWYAKKGSGRSNR
jgi:hypothetical protein